MNLVAFRNLSQRGGPEFTEAQVKALAAEYKIKDGPTTRARCSSGQGAPSDRFPSPFPNAQAAAAANGGKAPPDFSVLAKARTYERGFPWFILDALPFLAYQEQGADYIHACSTAMRIRRPSFKLPEGSDLQHVFPRPRHRHAEAAQRRPAGISEGPGRQAAGPGDRRPVRQGRGRLHGLGGRPHMERRKEMGFKSCSSGSASCRCCSTS